MEIGDKYIKYLTEGKNTTIANKLVVDKEVIYEMLKLVIKPLRREVSRSLLDSELTSSDSKKTQEAEEQDAPQDDDQTVGNWGEASECRYALMVIVLLNQVSRCK